VLELITVLSAKYGKTQEEVAADLIRIRPDMAQFVAPRQIEAQDVEDE